MAPITRRDFTQGSAALAAGALLGGHQPAFAAGRPASLSDIDHIIILMKENRSFDHYFGTLGGVIGYDDANAQHVFRQPDDVHADGHILPFRLDTTRTNAQRLHDLSHSWEAQHGAWNEGGMNGFVSAHRRTNSRFAPLTMGYYTREDLPFYYALADSFTVCDRYHSSLMGPTHPNRIMLMSASIDAEGKYGQPAIDNRGRFYNWETYPERLQRAGITWRVYHDADDYNCNVLKFFTNYQGFTPAAELQENALKDRSLDELLNDLRTGNIPQVTWIVPPSHLTEHPDFLPAAGEDHTSKVLAALWSNKELWAKTALILNYDENDGLFDHVAPPVPPAGTKGEYVGSEPVGLGFRVPCIMISPFSRGAYVSSKIYDHTSTMRLIETRFGVEVGNLSPWRRSVTGDLTEAFAFDRPPDFSVPTLPDTAELLSKAEETAASLPKPQVPDEQAMPRQESGTRIRLA